MSVATHQLRSSGHQRLALGGQLCPENAAPAARNGPLSSTIGRSGIATSFTAVGSNGALPYPYQTANQHADGIAVKRARTPARLEAWRAGRDPTDGGRSQTPG